MRFCQLTWLVLADAALELRAHPTPRQEKCRGIRNAPTNYAPRGAGPSANSQEDTRSPSTFELIRGPLSDLRRPPAVPTTKHGHQRPGMPHHPRENQTDPRQLGTDAVLHTPMDMFNNGLYLSLSSLIGRRTPPWRPSTRRESPAPARNTRRHRPPCRLATPLEGTGNDQMALLQRCRATNAAGSLTGQCDDLPNVWSRRGDRLNCGMMHPLGALNLDAPVYPYGSLAPARHGPPDRVRSHTSKGETVVAGPVDPGARVNHERAAILRA